MPTLNEWIAKYEQKAEEMIPLPGFILYFEPEHGFFYYRATNDIFEIDHTCADGKWAYNKANEMAKERGCHWLVTSTHRDPAAYMRMFHCTPVLSLSGIRPNGLFYWVFQKEVF